MARVVPASRRRVRVNSEERINARIDEAIARNVRYFSAHPEEIGRRLLELDQEWDVERVLEANAAALALLGTLRATRGARTALVLPILVTGLLLQHAIQGWCPPVPLLRRLGFRTAHEINRERYALKAVRGDFEGISGKKKPTGAADAALRAARE